jgi:sialic acid synthase SpsE
MAGIQPAETKNVVFRRSLFIVKDIKKGEIFTKENVRCIRPGYGLSPHLLEEIIGLSANFSAKRGTPLSREIVSISSNQENTVPNNEKN